MDFCQRTEWVSRCLDDSGSVKACVVRGPRWDGYKVDVHGDYAAFSTSHKYGL